jgi:predicted metal-dependent hydrolase
MLRSTSPEVPHSLTVEGRQITYLLRRSQRRTIGLGIDHRGLRIGAPLRARLGDIEKLICEHARWVFDKLDNWPAKQAKEALAVQDGTIISLLGEPLTVAIDPQRQRGHVLDQAALTLYLNARQAPEMALLQALQAEARNTFATRLAHYASLLEVPTPPLRLSSARTRWGSCNYRGHIALNWRLIYMPLPVIDYVVAHELAHLKEMNHSPRFWSVVSSLCPDWQARRQELKQLALTIPVL